MNIQNSFEIDNKIDVWPNKSSLVSMSHCELNHTEDQYRCTVIEHDRVGGLTGKLNKGPVFKSWVSKTGTSSGHKG